MNTNGSSDAYTSNPEGLQSAPELIVMVSPTVAAAAATGESALAASAEPLVSFMAAEGLTLQPLFGAPGDAPTEAAATAATELAMPTFYHVPDIEPERMEAMADQMAQVDGVAAAYVKPPAEPATLVFDPPLEVEDATADDAPAATPDFSGRQGYLYNAPAGIEAPYAWGIAGGKGNGVKVIDCEWSWNFNHEDLLQNQMGMQCGASSGNTHHGTAVHGEIGGDHNSFGVKGIAPNAVFGASSFANQPTAQAIRCAADKLDKGDIILLEIHRRGPNGNGNGQFGFIAVEWWPDDFAAIRYAVNKGIIVVEAAGNGYQNLDDAVYNRRPRGFPASWRNPFNTNNPSSGAVLVGAGDPPSGTHGRTKDPYGNSYVDRARAVFSNHGRRVDAQGWGWEVTTTGYGDLFNPTFNRLYTDTFSGTSSASPIVVGALAAVQGALKAHNLPLLTSQRAIQLLRQTGSPQQAAAGRPVSQRIGNRPNLRQLFPAASRRWHNNVTVTATFASTHTENAYAHFQGIGWRKIKTGAPDGVNNMFDALCEAVAAGRKVNVEIDLTTAYTLYLL